ncbi:MAG: hypothetical protein P1U36_02490 [Legionellaceae bacterium]|nr:hypothetical protein [Legionellaceae bacterium]
MQLEKRTTFSNDILFIDGLWGTGKSLLGPIVSSMSGVERVKVECLYEQISRLFSFGQINEDAALWMLRTYVDCSQYYNSIGREINLRWADDTGLKNTPNKLSIIKKLFGREGDFKVDEINQKNLAFCAMSHMLMLTPELLISAYGERVKVIEVVRHPLYMLDHFSSYLERFESAREFTMSFYHEGIKVPWFAKGWEAEFVQANSTERAVLCITRLYPWLNEKIDAFRAVGLAVLDVSFEEAVFDTATMLKKLEKFTNRKHSSCINRTLKKQKLPRESIGKGRGHASYGWSKSNKSESDTYAGLLIKVRDNCSVRLQRDMHQLIVWYNKKYPSRLGQFE